MSKAYIDAGHGGNDSGAPGVNNCLEKNIVLYVAKKVEQILKDRNIETRMSRDTDVFKTLNFRTTDANNWGADCLVSIHCNSFTDANSKGLEVFCYKYKYRKIADCIHKQFKDNSLYTVDRGVKEGNLHMVRESKMSACLVELGFITNLEDYNLIEAKKDEMALAIANGICDYLGIGYQASKPTNTTKIYNIVTGGFGNKEAAQEKLDHLYGLTGWYLQLEEFQSNDYRIRTGGFTSEDRVKKELEALKELTGWWCSYIEE